MPWKNPRCPKCHIQAGVKQIKFLEVTMRGTGYSDGMEYGRVIFKCKYCKHEWEDRGHRRIRKDKPKEKSDFQKWFEGWEKHIKET